MKINSILSGQLSNQLIHYMDHSISLNKRFVLVLRHTAIETWILQNKLNCTIFLLKINDLLHQIFLMELTEVIMAVHWLIKQLNGNKMRYDGSQVPENHALFPIRLYLFPAFYQLKRLLKWNNICSTKFCAWMARSSMIVLWNRKFEIGILVYDKSMFANPMKCMRPSGPIWMKGYISWEKRISYRCCLVVIPKNVGTNPNT